MVFSPERLARIDRARARPQARGLRDWSVSLLVITTTGDNPGEGTETATETPIVVNGGNPHVRQTSARQVTQDALRSDRYFEVTLTPGFTLPGFPTAGYQDADAPTDSMVLFVVRGPGLPASGLRCVRSGTKQTATQLVLTLHAKGF